MLRQSMLPATLAARAAARRPQRQIQQIVSRPRFNSSSSSASTQNISASAAAAGASAAARQSFLQRHPVIKWSIYGTGSIVFGLSATIAIILAHDALTYRDAHVDNIPASPMALHPQPGGPKNLPIVSDFIEGSRDGEKGQKERLVVVGGGWGAVALLSSLDPDKYDVTLVAPNNFYLFTPLLPSATVGTVEPRSLVEPLRKIIARVKGHYVQGRAVDIVMGNNFPQGAGGEERLLEVEVIDGHEPDATSAKEGSCNHMGKRVYIPYDRIVVAVGSVTNDHGVPGLDNCFHLKTISDARKIRSHILDNLEIAALPTTTPEEREKLLSFVVCGGGPTGVETAAEIYDMLNEDVLDYYPKLLRASAQIHLIQSREHILNTYSEAISDYAERKFARDAVNVIVNARVKRVEADKVVYSLKDPETGKVVEKEVPSGFTLWSTGIAMSPFTRRLTQLLPNQSHLKALQIDSHLRVVGAPLGSIYALGDASTIDTRLIDHIYDFVDQSDKDHDGQLSYDEFQVMAACIGRKYPIASKHFEKLKDMFDRYDRDKSGTLSVNEVADMLLETQSKMTSLPATAQVASQQGKYLAKKLNNLARRRDEGKEMNPHDDSEVYDLDDHVHKPFEYHNLGSLAYIGNAAAFDLPLPGPVHSFVGGLISMYAWRSFYLSEQVSLRTRLLLMSDWIRRGIYGRDVSRI